MNELDRGRMEASKEKKYIDIAEVILITLDTRGNIKLLNKKGYDVLEYEEGELLSKNWFETCIPECNREEVKDVFKNLIRGMAESSEFYENVIVTKNGRKKIIAWHNSLLCDENGKINGTISSGEDVTERKKIEQKLIESEEKFRTIAEETEIGIIIIQDGLLKYSNKAIDAISGYSQERRNEWTERNFIDLIIHEDSDFFTWNKVNDLVKGNIDTGEKLPFRIRTGEGDIKWIELTAKSIKYLGKEAVMFTILDISDKKKTEQELRKINKLKSELIKRTSHELKTPLISILGFTDLLINLHADKFNDEIITILREINEGANRLALIINNLLKTSQLQSNKNYISKIKEDLSFLIKFCVNELQGLAKARNLKIIVDIDEKMDVQIAKEDIHFVISNLIINAIKYTPPNGLIRIKSKCTDDFHIISIEDNGIGITMDESKQLFRRFGKIERYGNEWDVGIDGVGMGLYNSKKIINWHGGKMWVESYGRNKGSRFFFTLPVLRKEEAPFLREN